MPLPAQNVQAFGFGTCAGESTYSGTLNDIYGDKDCYEHDQQRAMFYWWAADVMDRTPQEGSDCNCGKCVTDEFACSVINLMGPGCIVCGCGSESDRPITCDITYNETVYQAADADQETVLPNVAGRTTLIISNQTPVTNNWSSHVGEIATDDGSANFTYSLPPVGEVILDAGTSTYYVAYTGGAGPLYPPIDGNLVFLNLTLFSRFPGVTAQYNRNVAVETSPDGVTWTVVYFGPESALLTGYTAVVSDSPTLTRSTYYYGEEDQCTFQYAEGSIPPFVPPPCGILLYDITPNSTCGTQNWTISVNFTQIDGWNIGVITPNLNGTPGTPRPITLGAMTFGPYVMGDLVTFTLENNIDIACNETTNTFHDPRVPEQDYNVLRAVDANEYATLSGDGEDYYIVSNVDSLVANWGLHVGEIWNGGTSTYTVPANTETTYATNPGGALGFWQDDNGVPKQYFPQPTFIYNTVTLITAVTLPPVAPYTQGWATLFMQALWTPPAGSPVTIYNGAPDSFTPQAFTIPNTTTWANVTGFAAYSDGCAVRVPAILDTFTPPGTPDPYFLGNGVNDIVRAIADSGQGDGSFYIGGSFWLYDPAGTATPCGGFTRLNTDGTLDTAFNSNISNPAATVPGFGIAGPGTARINAVEVDSLGRVVVVGDFTTWNDAPVGHIIRFNSDGTRDTTFNPGGAGFVAFTVFDVTILSDNSMVATTAGTRPSYNGVDVGWTCHISVTGTLITTEQWTPVSAGFNGGALRSDVDSDGTIVFNGNAYDTYNGTVVRPGTENTAIRVNPNGSLNGVIAQGAQFFEPAAPLSAEFAIQPDSSIVFVGNFTKYNNITVGRIVRTDYFGVPDSSFITSTGTGFNGQALGVDILPNGQITVGTSLGTSFDGTLQGGLTRLFATGALDPAWDLGTGFSGGPVYVVLVDTFGDLVVGGAFTSLDGNTYNRVVKLT